MASSLVWLLHKVYQRKQLLMQKETVCRLVVVRLDLFSRPSTFCHRDSLLAKRTFLRFVRFDIEMQECGARNIAKVDFAAAAIHQHADRNENAAVCAHDIKIGRAHV